MALAMTHPTKNPKTGVWRIRLTIPAHLRDLAAQHFGLRAEFTESLGTKDCAEARRLGPAVSAKFEARLAVLRGAHRDGPSRLTDEQVSSLCGQWLREQQEAWAQDSGTVAQWDMEAGDLGDDLSQTGAEEEQPATWRVTKDVDRMLTAAGLVIDADSRDRLGVMLLRTRWQWARDMKNRAETGRWQPTVKPEDFAQVPVSPPPAPTPSAAVAPVRRAGWQVVDQAGQQVP